MKKKFDAIIFLQFLGKGLKTVLIMKLALFLICVNVFTVFGNSYSQETKFTLKGNDVKLEDVLKEVIETSEFRFFYNNNLIDLNQNVNYDVDNGTVFELLDQIREETGIKYEVVDKTIILSPTEKIPEEKILEEEIELPQEKIIEGKVTDTDGLPLPGVSIVVKGTTIGITSDLDGNYSLSVPEDAQVLVFSFVGMLTREVAIEGMTRIDIEMEEETFGLEEVIAVGYTTVKQSQLTSSVSVVSSEKLQGTVSPNLAQMLQGKVGGLFISNSSGKAGDEPNINIRGSGSIAASSQPLYVVDGIIGGIPNPSDIETVTVLKDAAATGLYGSRAASGVIVITTKRGKEGKSQINFKATSGISKANFGKMEAMNSADLYAFQRTILGYEYENNSEGYGSLDEYMAAKDRPASLLNTDINWRDLSYRTGYQQNYELSVSGGSKNTRFYIGANYYNEKGTLVGDKYERYNIRANIDHSITDRIKLQFNVSGRLGNYENDATDHWSGGAKQAVVQNMPWDNPYDSEGNLVTGNEPGWTGKDINFLYPMQYNWDHGRDSEVSGDIIFNWDFTDWLSFSSRNRASFENGREEIYKDKRTAEGSSADGSVTNEYTHSQTLLTSNLLKARASSGLHNFNGLVGYEYNSTYRDNMLGTGVGIFPGLEVLEVTSEAFAVEGLKVESKFVSYLSQLNYNYDNKYFLSGSYRIDGSSRFGANNQFGSFYSIGASWLAFNEPFIKQMPSISNLKLRASYGSTGNSDIEDFLHLNLYIFDSAFNGEPAGTAERAANPYLTWEKAYTGNIGFDIGFVNRVNLSVDYYNTKNKDLLLAVPQAITSGFSELVQNIGSVRNQGLEFTLGTNNLTGDFKWTTDFNISFNKNEVLELSDGEDIITTAGGANSNQILSEGSDRFTWYLREWAGVDPDNGDPLWVKLTTDDDGNVTGSELTNVYNDATLQKSGSASPDYFGGMRNTMSYKGFSLDFYFNFVQGNLIYHSNRNNYDSDGAYMDYNQMKLADGWSRWEKPGDIATHPKPLLGGNRNSLEHSTRFLEDGSYIKLRNVTFAYNFPKSICNQIKLDRLKLFVSADNLLTFTDYSGFDPEVRIGGNVGTQYPSPKRFLFGIEIGL